MGAYNYQFLMYITITLSIISMKITSEIHVLQNGILKCHYHCHYLSLSNQLIHYTVHKKYNVVCSDSMLGGVLELNTQ